MKAFQQLLSLALCAMVLASCVSTDANNLRVTSKLPEGVIGRDAVFQLTFSRGVVPLDSVNQWTRTEFVEFTPPIPGKFVWEDTTRLVFSPDGQLSGDAKFSARLNTDLLTKLAGASKFDGPESFAFETERFTLRSAEFFYDRMGEKREVGIKANLEFSYAVNPQDVFRYLKVTIDGQQHPVSRVVSTENSKVIAVEIGVVTQLDRQRAVVIDFGTDLVSTETGTGIKMDKPFTYNLPPLGDLAIYGHEFGYDGTTSWIKVKTSQEVDPGAVKAHLRLEPIRSFSVRNDGDGFTLVGSFEPGTSFRLLIKEGMTSVLGGKTSSAYEADIVIGNVAPSFGFASTSGLYMLLGGQKKLEIKTINMSKLAVRVSQIFQNNLVFFLDGGRYYDYSYEDYGDETTSRRVSRKYRYYMGNYGRQIRYDSITIATASNREVTTLFDLSPYINTGYKGFYLVEIADLQQAWRSTSKLISLSDIGLIVKRSGNEVVVFTTNLVTTEPMGGVLVSLISTNNQVIAAAKSDNEGVVRFPDFQSTVKDFQLKLITAEAENDFNFINLDDYRVETSRFDVGGKRSPQVLYDAMVYGDRNIYRPGERVYVSGIVRDFMNPLPQNMPVRLRVYNPRGTMVQDMQHVLNPEGSFETSFPTQPTSLTGDYRCELLTGNNLFLASYKISVEDFVPDRLRVTVTPSQESARPGETVQYELLALNFFGPPAAGRNWEFEGSFDALPYVSKAYPDFRFSDDGSTDYSADPVVANGKTDQEGKAVVEFEMPKNLTATGLLRAKGRVAVFDESGRPVYQLAQTIVHPRDYHIGVRNLGAYYVNPNAPQKMQIVAVDAKDNLLKNFRVRVDLIRYEWHSVLRQHQETGTLRYVSERREIPVKTDRITVSDKPADYTYSAPRSGDYVLRISKDGDAGFNQVEFYSYSWGTSDITSFEVDPEARVDILLDKELYSPGDNVRVLFQTPFSGKLLVTVERNQVFTHRYLDVTNNAASMEFTLEERHVPNVYVSAVLFRKITDMNIPLLAGHGFVPVMVEKKSNKLDVQIQAPEKIRPKTQQRIIISTGGERDVYVTLAAVDEGICQVKNYKSPDPYGYFYARKALETETFDFFRDLLPEPQEKKKSSPGGGEAEMGLRANPLGVQRFKPLALWSGILRSGSGGTIEVPLAIPEFNGEVRLMAVAYKANRFGSAQKAMKVADPIVLSPALPRFLSPGDSLSMSITAFNTTEKRTSLDFGVTTVGGLVLRGKPEPLQLDPNQERFVTVGLRATNQIGAASVAVHTTAWGEKIESTTDLPVRPTAPFATDAFTGFVDGGKSVSHAVNDGYLPYGRRAHVSLSPYPVVNFAKDLKSLLGYPHGCVEQTVSKAFPQLYLRDIASVLAPSAVSGGSPTYFVNEAIAKLSSLQLPDGSFAFWPGGSTSNPWSTVYATHFLVEARKAGYSVMEGMMNAAKEATARIARDKKTEDYSYYERNKTLVRRIADKSCVYALYVLAIAGAPERSVMSFYRAERGLLTNDTRYLLAGAFALSGDRKTYSDLLPPQFVAENPVRTSGGDFDSPVRATAIMLNVLLETDLNNPQIPQLMEYLSRAFRPNEWYSTQDDAMTLLAFGKAARMASAATVSGTVSIGGKESAYTGGTQKFDCDPFGKNVTITTKGSGRVYYSLVVEGIRTDGKVKVEDRNLQVRREILDRTGSPVSVASVRQNDLLVVRLTLTSSVDKLEYVAITDLLPAGFEIENPRLTEATQYAFIKNAAVPEYMDIRDDRLNIYTSFSGGHRQQVFYYAVRAVSPGEFQYPPVVAEAMYNPYYYSASGEGKLRVVR